MTATATDLSVDVRRRAVTARRELIVQLTQREVAQRYRGSVLGVVWSLVTPLIMLAIYTLVFGGIFHTPWEGPSRLTSHRGYFPLMLFAGLIPFTVFAEVVGRAPTLILSVPNYVKKVVFPLEVLPVVATAAAIVQSLISMTILLVGAVVLLHTVSRLLWLLPLVYLPLALSVVGIAWFLASLGMYIRDIAQAVGPVVAMFSFLTPIFYPITLIPPHYRWAMYLNPMTVIVESFRHCVLLGDDFPWLGWSIVTLLSMLIAIGGYAWFKRTQRGFADLL